MVIQNPLTTSNRFQNPTPHPGCFIIQRKTTLHFWTIFCSCSTNLHFELRWEPSSTLRLQAGTKRKSLPCCHGRIFNFGKWQLSFSSAEMCILEQGMLIGPSLTPGAGFQFNTGFLVLTPVHSSQAGAILFYSRVDLE